MLISLVLLFVTAEAAPPVVAIAVTPDGAQVVAGSQAGIQVVSLPELAAVSRLATKLEHVHDLAFSPRGDLLAVAGGSPGERGIVELWEWPAGKLQATLAAGDDVAYSVAWNAEGTQLAVASGDKSVRLMAAQGASDDTPTHSAGAPVPTTLRPHSAAVLAVAWLGDDNLVLSAGVDQTIRVLKPASGETVRSLDNHTGAVRDLAVRVRRRNGPTVVASAGADRTVRFWQPGIGRLVRFARLPVAPTAICWTEDAAHVLVACEDGRLRAIDYESLAITELAEHLEGWAHDVTILPGDKSALLAGERGQLRIVRLDAINP
jgi:WD40 repeat protein